MTPATVTHPNRGLPLSKPRSAVFSPRRERTQLNVRATASDLAAAIALVLHRYHGISPVPMGLGQAAPERVDVPIEPADTMGNLRGRTARLLDRERPSARSGEGSRNLDFDVSVLNSAPQLDYREDVVVYATQSGIEALWRVPLLDAATVDRFMAHVHAAISAPNEAPHRDVHLLSASEEELICGFETGGVPLGSPHPVHIQVAEQARRDPALTAIEIGSQAISYSELNRRSSQIARVLVNRGVAVGDAVAICVSPGKGVIALLGILRAGAAVVPVDATLPIERLRVQLNLAKARLAVVDHAWRDSVPDVPRLSMDDIDNEAAELLRDEVTLTDDSPAYILFTSGSTGVPKGITMSHRGLTNLVGWQVARSAPSPRTLQRTSLAFDVGMQEILSTLCAGGCLVVADEDTRIDPSRLPEFIATHGIERVFLPPVSLYQMAAAFDTRPRSLPTLREVYVAGEALKLDPVGVRFFRAVDATLENQYGPTETHVATTFRFRESPLRWPSRPPIGRPVPGVEVRIVDDRGRRVPIGTAGEIVVRGRQVAIGYLDGPLFMADDGGPIYATGDIGWWTAAGDIQFVGRRDRQVKVRGYRIESAEVEIALQSLPGIRSAVVAAVEENDTPRLLAWIVTDSAFAGVGVARRQLLHVLPEYMVPALNGFAVIDELPLTPTGKVDFAALVPPGRSSLASTGVTASLSELESIVADIWRRELGISTLNIQDDFVAIGGHSLAAIRIVSQLNERFGVSLPLRLLLRGGTVAAVANRLAHNTAIDISKTELIPCSLPDGQTVVAPSAGEARYLWHDVFAFNSYGPPIEYYPGAVIVDVGAHIGLYVLYALRAAPSARVLAIEPVPLLFDALTRNTERYRDRIAYFRAAAGEADGTASLTYYPKLSGMSSLRADPISDAALLRTIIRNTLDGRPETDPLLRELDEIVSERLDSQALECPVRRLQTILDDAAPDRIDVLKIDVQRYEEPALYGVGNAWPRVRQVVVEVHDENRALSRIDKFLRANGFSTQITQQPIHAGTPVRFVTGVR